MKRWLPLALFLFALALRLVGNTFSPPSPYWEEAALGYDAYSILRTGADHHGAAFPVVAFTSFGDFKPSLYFYALVPSVAAFGLNTFAVRLPAALASAVMVWLLFRLLKKWSSERVALWSALVLAAQPWSWQVGRAGLETNLAACLLLLGTLLLSEAVDRVGKWHFLQLSLGAAASFALSMYAYHGARLLAPLLAAAVFGLNTNWPRRFSELKRLTASWLPAVLLAVAIVLPIGLALRTPAVQQRVAETSVFSSRWPVEQSNRYREANGYSLASRFVYHRYWYWLAQIASSYLSHFSPQFLFGQGDVNPRHTSQLFGALYPWELLTVLVGLAYGRRHFREQKRWRTVLALLLLSPAAAALTHATPHALRALPLAPWLAVLSGIGLVEIVTAAQKRFRRLGKLLPLGALGLLAGSLAVLVFYYFSQYRIQYAQEWQYGYQELFTKLRQQQKGGEPIYVSRFQGRPAMFLWFYEKTDPRLVQNEEQTAAKDQGERLTFQEWKFVDGGGDEAGLHAVSADVNRKDAPVIDTVDGLAGEPLWVIYRR